MTLRKESKIDKKVIKKQKDELGSELGAVIQNNRKNYPDTGSWKVEMPKIDKDVCIGCGACAQHCPEATIMMKDVNGKKKAVVRYEFCKGCGVCAEVCPVKAITMIRKT